MKYILDTNAFRTFQFYYPSRFPSLWERFDGTVAAGKISSVREVKSELNYQVKSLFMLEWLKNNKHIFSMPSVAEMEFVREIFAKTRFHNLVPLKARLQGKPVADPFVIAAAKIKDGCVVTQEQHKPNAAKIPNVCEYYDIPFTDIEGFMEMEAWTF